MKIKNLMAILMTFSIVFAVGCKKEETTTPAGSNNAGPLAEVGDVPATFTKKIVIEKYTGEWCVNCPDGVKVLNQVLSTHPNQSIGVEVHQGDWLELPQLATLRTHLGGIAGYPRASLDRVPASGTTSPNQDGLVVYSRGNWPGMASKLVAEKANAGLALTSTISGDKLNIKVFAASLADISSDTRLTVYILEDNIVANNQVGGGAGYTHHHVLRKVVSDGLGDKISLKAGSPVIKEYNDIDISAFKAGDLKVVAFVNVVGNSSSEHGVLNGKEAKAGEVAKWD